MFGFSGGEHADTVLRKRDYLQSAQARWAGLTRFDLSTIKNEAQLVALVKGRCRMSKEHAVADVQEWMGGKLFRDETARAGAV